LEYYSKGSVSSSGSRFEIIDRNIIGSGHELNTKFRNRFSDGKMPMVGIPF
jgi:hypothetical protein